MECACRVACQIDWFGNKNQTITATTNFGSFLCQPHQTQACQASMPNVNVTWNDKIVCVCALFGNVFKFSLRHLLFVSWKQQPRKVNAKCKCRLISSLNFNQQNREQRGNFLAFGYVSTVIALVFFCSRRRACLPKSFDGGVSAR